MKNTNITTSSASGGVTFNVNDDGSVIANGTALSNVYCRIIFTADEDIDIIFSGCPSSGTYSSYWQNLLDYTTDTNLNNDLGKGCNASLVTGHTYYFTMYIASGYTADNLVFYPMIRDASIADDTYEPYVEDVDTRLTQITSDIDGISPKTKGWSTSLKVTAPTSSGGLFIVQTPYEKILCDTSGNKINVRDITYISDSANSVYGAIEYTVDALSVTFTITEGTEGAANRVWAVTPLIGMVEIE